MATERSINNEAHRAQAAALTEETQEKKNVLTGEPAEHHTREGEMRRCKESEIRG